MGYRSCGKLYLTPKVYDILPDNLKEDLTDEWETETTSFDNDNYMIWSFEDWKWYPDYEDVKKWNSFFDSLEENEDIDEMDWDFIVIGEDNAIIDHRTQNHLAISSNIEVF